MAILISVVNLQHQTRTIYLQRGERITVAGGDKIRVLNAADIKTLRKGNDLVIQNAQGKSIFCNIFMPSQAMQTKSRYCHGMTR